jgi:DNA invertase Pin-like site-specific DNA recombinase
MWRLIAFLLGAIVGGGAGPKGRDRRPAFDKLCRDAARREFDMVMAWSVDRLGCRLQDLVGFCPNCTS